MGSNLPTNRIESDVIYTVKDIMNILHIGETNARKLIISRGFPSMKIGRQYRIVKSEFDKWLKQNSDKEITL